MQRKWDQTKTFPKKIKIKESPFEFGWQHYIIIWVILWEYRSKTNMLVT